MTDYIDYPHPYHIDASFGQEYDPYPGSRVPRPTQSWISTGHSQQPRQGSTPGLSPVNLATSPIPAVHRLTRDDGDPARSPVATRSPGRLNFPMPGASRFREFDQPEPTRWTSPTNVSFPASQRPSWAVAGTQPPAMRAADGVSVFAPRQASTPAPTHYEDTRTYMNAGPGYGFPDREPQSRYGAPVHDDDTRSGRGSMQQEYEGSIRDEDFEEEVVPGDRSYDDDGDAPSDEEYVSIPAESADHHHQGPLYSAPEPVEEPKKKGKRFVGGFMSNFRLFPRRTKSAPQEEQSTVEPEPGPSHNLQPSRRQPQYIDPPSGPFYDLGPREHAPQQMRRPVNTPYPQGDQSLSTDPTPSTPGPVTPADQVTELPTAEIPDIPENLTLPNPHDSRLITAPVDPGTPEQVELRHADDYDEMTEPYDDRPDTTFSSRVNRVGKFLSDLTHLPWITPTNVAVTYSPFESRRARYAGDKPGVSWYTKENHEKLDLLAGPAQPRQATRPRPQNPAGRRPRDPNAPHTRRPRTPPSGPSTPSRNRDAATAIRPTRTPLGATSGGMTPSSPGASSHGNGQHSMSYNYYYAAPQPLYVYPSSVASPQMRGRSAPEGPIPIPIAMQNVPGQSAQQAVPVYMLATPAPLVMPKSSSGRQHRRPSRSSGRGYQYAMPIPVPTMPSPSPGPRSPPHRSSSRKSPGTSKRPEVESRPP